MRFVKLVERIEIIAAEFAAFFAAAEKRRVANDGFGLRPVGCHIFTLPGRAGGDQRIAAFNRIEIFQHRVGRHGETVFQHPLDFADPHHHPRQLGGVGVEFDAGDTFRAEQRGKVVVQAELLGFQHHFVLQVFEGFQRQIEKVAAAAGGVEHAECAQAFEKAVVERLGFRLGLF